MNPSHKRESESLVALLKREDWYHFQTSSAESSCSHVLDSTLAHCRISPVTVSQTPNSSTATAFTSKSATTSSSSSIISFLQDTGNKASVYNQGSRKVINTWLFHVSQSLESVLCQDLITYLTIQYNCIIMLNFYIFII